ncbi:hypothetical protein HYX12_04470 [Candidatus Woesearchaeota archaeon]|nr:hypothetical protein [Candidatus Woesearchaeota archaeon]
MAKKKRSQNIHKSLKFSGVKASRRGISDRFLILTLVFVVLLLSFSLIVNLYYLNSAVQKINSYQKISTEKAFAENTAQGLVTLQVLPQPNSPSEKID